MRENLPTCSFCGAVQDETRKVVAGAHESGICAECVGIGSALLLEDANVRQSVFRSDAGSSSSSCSFCGKEQRDVWRLLFGDRRNVCSECLTACNEIFGDDGDRTARERAAEIRSSSGIETPLPGAVLQGYVVANPDSFLRRMLDRLF